MPPGRYTAMANVVVALSLLALTSCASVPTGPALTGAWGGDHVGLTLQPAGGSLDYDCASGTIGPVTMLSGGRFTATGTHSPGHGGPDRVDEVPARLGAVYSGSVRGDTMVLNVSVDPATVLGPYTLRRGAQPNLLRCL